jgi:mycothiol system anti-sigma-R factor
MKDCSRITKLLYLYLDGELDPGQNREVEKHILDCRECSDLLDEERRFLSLIKNGSLREAAPQSLQVKIERMLEKKQRPFFHIFTNYPLRMALAMTVTVLLLFVGIQFWNGQGTIPPFVQASVVNHEKYIQGSLALEVTSSDPEVVFAWFKERMSSMPVLPVLKDDNIVLVGGRVLNFEGSQMALVSYLVEKKPVTMSIVPETPQTFVESDEHTFLHGRRFNFTHADGLNTVAWSDDGNNFALVSGLHSQEIKSCVVCHAKGSGLVDINALLSI